MVVEVAGVVVNARPLVPSSARPAGTARLLHDLLSHSN